MKGFLKKTLFAAALVLGLSACQKPDSQVGIQSFSLTKALNSALPYDVNGVVDETSKTITLTIPTSAGTDSFVPTFTVTEYDEVTIAGTPVTSGTTSVKISNGTKVNVDDNVSNLSVSYTINVLNNDGAAELVSVSFKAADNDLLSEDVAPEAVAPEMIVRVPGAAFKQELVMTVSAGMNDAIKVNGESVASGSSIKVDTQFPIDIIVTDEVAKSNSSYVLKVGKILQVVATHLTTYKEGTMGTDVYMDINPKDGAPYIAYVRKLDGESNNSVSVAKWNGSAFELVGETGINAPTKAASRATLAFAADGTTFVKYVGGEVSSRNSVQKFNGSSWELVGDAGYGDVNVNTTYLYPIVVEPGSSNPTVFFNGNTKNTPTYRNMSMARFDGSSWSTAAVPNAPVYGAQGGSDGMYYVSATASYGDKLYMVSAYNQYGFYVQELTGNGVVKNIIENYLPDGEQHGLPSNIGIACDKDGVIYILEVLRSKNAMQIFKVNADNSTITPYGAAFPGALTISSSGSVTEDAAFGISSTSNQVFGVMDSAEKTVKFMTLDESLAWSEIKTDFAAEPKSTYMVKSAADGTVYVAFSTADGIELFSLGLEADILPE